MKSEYMKLHYCEFQHEKNLLFLLFLIKPKNENFSQEKKLHKEVKMQVKLPQEKRMHEEKTASYSVK